VLVAALESLDSETAPGDSLTGALGRAVDGRECLLVLDGLDLDTTAAGPVLQSMLEATSDARVVVTALTTAGQPAESVVRVGPLPVPAPRAPLEGPAVELFLRRIRAAGGQQVDLAAQAHEVHRLLRATGGLPLLIEQVAVQSALVGLSNAMSAVSLDQAVDSAHDLLDGSSAAALRRIGLLDFHVGLGVLAHVLDASVPETAELAGNLVRRSLLEVDARGHFDMLSPIRGRARALARPDDVAAVRAGLLAWAETHAPAHDNYGAADAEWLGDLPAMRHAVLTACADPETRADGYSVANRIFSSLYTSMRAREAVEILEGALASGDGPPAMGAQIARRAGIAASEMRGTYEGLWLLARSDEHASSAPIPEEQLSKTASIRAEMHLDAGDLDRAEDEARRAIALDHGTDHIAPQATRTLAQAKLVRGDFAGATELAHSLLTTRQEDEPWLTLSARLLLSRIALEQGRRLEATTAAQRVYDDAHDLAEDRLALLAEVELCHINPTAFAAPDDDDAFPWAVRLPIMVAQARRLMRTGDLARAAGRAADAVVLADSSRLGRDALDARLVLGFTLLQQAEVEESRATLLQALANSAAIPSPLRAADVLDSLAHLSAETDPRAARSLAATAVALRTPRSAGSVGRHRLRKVEPSRTVPGGWVVDDQLTLSAVAEIAALLAPTAGQAEASPLDVLTPAERTVADKVAEGLTSRQIASDLFLSPRTVDAHLSRIYRKLDINTRARLAALVTDHG